MSEAGQSRFRLSPFSRSRISTHLYHTGEDRHEAKAKTLVGHGDIFEDTAWQPKRKRQAQQGLDLAEPTPTARAYSGYGGG